MIVISSHPLYIPLACFFNILRPSLVHHTLRRAGFQPRHYSYISGSGRSKDTGHDGSATARNTVEADDGLTEWCRRSYFVRLKGNRFFPRSSETFKSTSFDRRTGINRVMPADSALSTRRTRDYQPGSAHFIFDLTVPALVLTIS